MTDLPWARLDNLPTLQQQQQQSQQQSSTPTKNGNVTYVSHDAPNILEDDGASPPPPQSSTSGSGGVATVTPRSPPSFGAATMYASPYPPPQSTSTTSPTNLNPSSSPLNLSDETSNGSSSGNTRSRLADPVVFWADHEAWLAEARAAQPKSVNVSDPQLGPRTLTNPSGVILYLVTCEPPLSEASRGGVRRRYSDFETLRNHLQVRFSNILLPSLPEKRILGGKNDDFLLDRQRGLLMFLERVVSDPYLFLDSMTRAFLGGSPAEWEVAKRLVGLPTPASPSPVTSAPLPPQANASSTSTTQIPNSTSAVWSPSPTLLSTPSDERWRAAVTMRALPDNYETEMQRSRVQLADLDDALKSMVTVLSKVAVIGRSHAVAVTEAARTVTQAGQEKTGSAGTALSFLANPLRSWSDAALLEPVLIEEVLLESLADEHDLIKNMRRLVEERDAEAQAADRALRALNKLEVEREGFEKMGQLDKAAKMAPKIQEAQRAVKSGDYKVEFATKALFYAGLPTYVASRIRAVGIVFAKLAIGQVRYGELTRSIWLGFVSAVGVDMDELAKDESTIQAMQSVEAKAGVFKGVFALQGGLSS